MRNCRVAKNRLSVKAKSDRRYTLVAGSMHAAVTVSYDGCLFESNAVVEVGGEVETCALGILGNGNEGAQKSAVLNCTFADNTVTAVNPVDGIVRSQGVVYGASSAVAARMAVANCTFRHEEESGLYDIAMVDSPGNDFYVVNSIFTRGPTAQYAPIYASVADRLYRRACSVGGETDEDATADAIPLERVLAANGAAVWRPCCKMPSLRDSVNIVTNSITACALDATRPPVYVNWKLRNDADTGWIALLGDSLVTKYEAGGLGDAAGETRPLGAFTRGAVQTLSAAAEAGNTLILRTSPWGAGTFAPNYWQIFASGAAPAAVTATPLQAGTVISFWEDDAGTTISSDNPLSPGFLPDGITTLTAVFTVPKVAITFDLGVYGTFDDGTTKKVLSLEQGTPLSAPTVTENDDYVFTGWTPALPDKVPTVATTFSGTGVPKKLRVIRLAPADDPVAAAGKGDGSSWADAYRGDLAAAYADAATYRGEVWMKKGAYDVSAAIALKSNVRLLGGFAGTETEASAADPAANVVIITGDLNHDDYYKINNGSTSGGAVIDYAAPAFNAPQPATRETYWAAVGNNADDAATGFSGVGVVTNCVLEGVVITGFRNKAITTEATCRLALVKCRVVANNTGFNNGADNAAILVYGSLEATDCDFWATHTPLTVKNSGTVYAEPTVLTRCTFRYNHGSESGTGGAFSHEATYRDLVIDGCEFSDNFVWQYQGYQRTPVYIVNARSLTMRDTIVQRNTYKKRCNAAFTVGEVQHSLLIERCVFRDNMKIGHGTDSGRASAALALGTLRVWDTEQHVIRDTLFEQNSVVRQNESNSSTMSTVAQASCLQHSYGHLAIVNCSFVSNRTDTAGAAAGSTGSTVRFCGNYGQATMVNCVFKDNEVKGYTTTDVRCETQYAKLIANTVFAGTADGYEPFAFTNPSSDPFSLTHCRLTGYTAEKYAEYLGTSGFDVANSAEVPPVDLVPTQGANGAWANAVRCSARGTAVWLGNDGRYYIHLPEVSAAKPWRSSFGAVAAVPTSEAKPATCVCDAWGVAPMSRKHLPSLGPVNYPNAGFMLLVK